MLAHISSQCVTSAFLTLGIMACSDSTQFSASESAPLGRIESSGASSSDATAGQNKDLETIESEDSAASDQSSKPEDTAGSPPVSTGTPSGNSGSSLPSTEIFLACSSDPDRSIVAKVYQLAVDTKSLPNFTSMTSSDEVCMSLLNISERDFSQGFPGVQNLIEWFGLDIRFRLKAPTSGNYTFYINSDDGSILYVDGVQLINNDNLHEKLEKSAQVNLTAGYHDFHIKYFQGPRYQIALELFWKQPASTAKVYVPKEVISRPQ